MDVSGNGHTDKILVGPVQSSFNALFRDRTRQANTVDALVGEQGETKALEQDSQRDFQFQHGKFCPKATARAGVKGEIFVRGRFDCFPAIGVEEIWIRI